MKYLFFTVILIAGFLQSKFITIHAETHAERPETVATKNYAAMPGDSLFVVSPGITMATVVDSKNQFYIVNGTPDKTGRIYIRFNGSVRSMAPGNRINFSDENGARRYFVYKGIENGQFIFYLQNAVPDNQSWPGTSASTTATSMPNPGSSNVNTVSPVANKPVAAATPEDPWLSLKSFVVFPGTTSATIVDSKNQFFIARGTPDQYGRITIRFNGSTHNMAPGSRASYKTPANKYSYFVYKGIENGSFVFYIHDFAAPEPEWKGTTAPDTTGNHLPLKSFTISPGTTSATLIDKMNQFFVSKGNPDQYGRIAVRFNGRDHGMAPGNRMAYKNDSNKYLYFVYKGIEKGQFLFYTQKHEY